MGEIKNMVLKKDAKNKKKHIYYYIESLKGRRRGQMIRTETNYIAIELRFVFNHSLLFYFKQKNQPKLRKKRFKIHEKKKLKNKEVNTSRKKELEQQRKMKKTFVINNTVLNQSPD